MNIKERLSQRISVDDIQEIIYLTQDNDLKNKSCFIAQRSGMGNSMTHRDRFTSGAIIRTSPTCWHIYVS